VEISRSARGWVEESLTHEFNGKVELSSFRVAIAFPLVQGEGENPALYFQGRFRTPSISCGLSGSGSITSPKRFRLNPSIESPHNVTLDDLHLSRR